MSAIPLGPQPTMANSTRLLSEVRLATRAWSSKGLQVKLLPRCNFEGGDSQIEIVHCKAQQGVKHFAFAEEPQSLYPGHELWIRRGIDPQF